MRLVFPTDSHRSLLLTISENTVTKMSRIVHLQGLSHEASSRNVRDFFGGLMIADGGVHITTSQDGSVFVTFKTDIEAEAALDLNGRRIFGDPVKLSPCSRDRMNHLLRCLDEEEREQFDGLVQEDELPKHDIDLRGPIDFNNELQEDSSKYKTLFEPEAVMESPPWNKERDKATILDYYYLRIRNLPQDTTVDDLMAFFRGIEPDGLLLRDEETDDESIAAFAKFKSKSSFQAILQKDKQRLKGERVIIRECDHAMYELEKDLPPVMANMSSPTFQDHEMQGPGDGFNSYVVVVENLDPYVTKNDIFDLMKNKLKQLKVSDISIEDDFSKKNHKLAHVLIYGNEEALETALSFNGCWFHTKRLIVVEHQNPQGGHVLDEHKIQQSLTRVSQQNMSAFKKADQRRATLVDVPILFLSGLDEAVSPKEIRSIFGKYADYIPTNGILIRPDMKADEYIAFVRFIDLVSRHKAEMSWKDFHSRGGTRIVISLCTTYLIQKYSVESIWKLDETREENREQNDRSSAFGEDVGHHQRLLPSPPSSRGMQDVGIPSRTVDHSPLLRKPPMNHEARSGPMLCRYPWESQETETNDPFLISPSPREMSGEISGEYSRGRSPMRSPMQLSRPGRNTSFSMSPSPPREIQAQTTSWSPNRNKIMLQSSGRYLRSRSRSPIRSSRGVSPIRRSQVGLSPVRSSHELSLFQNQNERSPVQNFKELSPIIRHSPRQMSWGLSPTRGMSPLDRSQELSPTRAMSPVRRSLGVSPTRRRSPVHKSRDFSPTRGPSPVHKSPDFPLRRGPSPVQRSRRLSPRRRSSPVQRSRELSLTRELSRLHRSRDFSPTRGPSAVHGSRQLSPTRGKSPVQRSSQMRIFPKQKSPVRSSQIRRSSARRSPKQRSPVQRHSPRRSSRGRSPKRKSRSLSPIRSRSGSRMRRSRSRSPKRDHSSSKEHRPRRSPSPSSHKSQSYRPPPAAYAPPLEPAYGLPPGYGPPPVYGMPAPAAWMPPPSGHRPYLGSPPSYGASPYQPYVAPSPAVAGTDSAGGGGKFLRISPLPEWANEAWLYQLFAECAVKKASVLIKFNGTKPIHAYMECETSVDAARAQLLSGMVVGNSRINVEALGRM